MLGPRSAWLGLAGRVAAGQGMSSAATLFFRWCPCRSLTVNTRLAGVILARLHAALQATSDTWQTLPSADASPHQTTIESPCGCGREDLQASEGGVRANSGKHQRPGVRGRIPVRGKGAEKCECNVVGNLKIPRRRARWWSWCSMRGVVLTSPGRDLSVAAWAAGNQSRCKCRREPST